MQERFFKGTEKTLDFSRKMCYNHKMIVIQNGEVRLYHLYISEGGNSYNERTGRKFRKEYGKINH